MEPGEELAGSVVFVSPFEVEVDLSS